MKQSFPWNQIIRWYQIHGRKHLPWRDYNFYDQDIGIYGVWLAEILLQQTQAERVILYWKNIVQHFPNIHALSESSYETFFPYYQGMGYYSRARNILKTATIISKEYNGIFPINKILLQKLPGVGGYTSSAILAFGYGKAYLAWDTNLEKVFSRYYHGTKERKLTMEEKLSIEQDFQIYIQTISEELQISYIRAINNGIMDFASLIDKKSPENIHWEDYFLKESVFYKTQGSLESSIAKKSISFPTPDATIILVLHKEHKVYYSPESPSYTPFILPPSLTRDTRKYVQDFFRKAYNFEVSVRPIAKKWLSREEKPYILIFAQIQVGNPNQFREYDGKAAKEIIKNITLS